MKYSLYLLLFSLSATLPQKSYAQLPTPDQHFTHADTLRGSLSPLRTCYDINYYHLDLKFNIAEQFISGSNLFKFTATQDFRRLQFDLFDNLHIDKIVFHNELLQYIREGNAVFVSFPVTLNKGASEEFTVFYSGHPTVTQKAPRFGGLVFAKDSLDNPFVATACEASGASIWWPNKDHLADEVDSMLISISVPKGLKDVSNGRLRKITPLKNGFTRFDWFVANPINNYNVAVNIARYAHFSDQYKGKKGMLTLDYWMLPNHKAQSSIQFEKNVKPMLAAYEHWFGPYPFYEDGYKLVETPYPAMEHQSAISYGGYLKGSPPNKLIAIPGGPFWDFIIVHESAHEWFGNSITAKDLADLWIHEAFASYAESLFVESINGKLAGQEYAYRARTGISNDYPIVAPYNVNQMGSGDMYAKGAALLNMLRTIVDDDDKWLKILRGLNEEFYHQTVTYEEIVSYFNAHAERNLTPVFDQYLKFHTLPVLEFMEKEGQLSCRWIAEAKDFNMPVKVKVKDGGYQMIFPTNQFSPVAIQGATTENIKADTFNYYIGILID